MLSPAHERRRGPYVLADRTRPGARTRRERERAHERRGRLPHFASAWPGAGTGTERVAAAAGSTGCPLLSPASRPRAFVRSVLVVVMLLLLVEVFGSRAHSALPLPVLYLGAPFFVQRCVADGGREAKTRRPRRRDGEARTRNGEQ
jgi:hypothetical protein